MKSIGFYLFFFGIGSILLNQFGYEFSILMWIDNWGVTVGWAIRLSAVFIGGLLWLIGSRAERASGT